MGSAIQRKRKRNLELITTSLRVDRDKLDRFRSAAESNQRTVSQELRWLMDRAVEEHEEKAAA